MSDDYLGVRELLDEDLSHFTELALAQKDDVEHEHLGQHVECGEADLEVDVINQRRQELDEAT